MKKNLIFGISLILVVLMASSVFAGWFGLTGNALRTGERITDDSSLTVQGIEDNKVRIGDEIYSKGETFTDSGKTYEVRAIEKKAWLFGSDKVVIEEVKPLPKPVKGCIDSDGGLDYFVRGDIYFEGELRKRDRCVSETKLDEYYCVKEEDMFYGQYDFLIEQYNCPEGCSKGVCNERESVFTLGIKKNISVEGEVYEVLFENLISSVQGVKGIWLQVNGERNSIDLGVPENIYSDLIVNLLEVLPSIYGSGEPRQVKIEFWKKTYDGRDENSSSLTYQGVLKMLNSCIVVQVGVPAQTGVVQTGNYVCSQFDKVCASNFIGFDPNVSVSGATNKISRPISCDDATNNYRTASWGVTLCCSAP